jgi:hypothetical protein
MEIKQSPKKTELGVVRAQKPSPSPGKIDQGSRPKYSRAHDTSNNGNQYTHSTGPAFLFYFYHIHD